MNERIRPAGLALPSTTQPPTLPRAREESLVRNKGVFLVCVLIFAYSYVHQNFGANQNSRLDLLHAIFVHGTFRIDHYHSNTIDKSIFQGHYYSDKAPGIAFLAIPSFAFSVIILKLAAVPLDSPRGWLLSSWITTIGSVGLITALGGLALFAFLCRIVPPHFALTTTLVAFLGSAPFPYATMLFSHAAVIGLISIAIWAIAYSNLFSPLVPCSANSDLSPRIVRRCILAGVCCGFAISSEFTAAPAAGGILILSYFRGLNRSLIVGLASLPPLLLIPLYNNACFGTALSFGYHNLALPGFQQMNQGFFGITFPPRLHAAYLLLISPERGLLFWTPFFILAALGYKWSLAVAPKLALIALSVVFLQIICISGYYMPNGGRALGPRHLAPAIPFLTILAALGLSQYDRIGKILGGWSILLTGTATLIDAMPPSEIQDPFWNYYLPRLSEGRLATTVGSFCGIPSLISTAFLFLFIFGAYLWSVSARPRSAEENISSEPVHDKRRT
jgi:hypothetical protein